MPPEEKDDDVAAFARTRVNPGVATNPHSGECGYTSEEVFDTGCSSEFRLAGSTVRFLSENVRHYTEDGMQPPGCDVVGSIGPRWARRALALG